MIKRKVSVAILVLLAVCFTVIPIGTGQFNVEASEAYKSINNETGTVTAADVNLRTGPATTYNIICKLKKNQKVTVIGKMGDWYAVYVASSGNIGAITSRYVKVKEDNNVANNKENIKNSTKKDSTKATKTTTIATATKIADISSDEQAMLDLVNKERKRLGLDELKFDANLVKIARLKANDMKNNNYFSHTSKLYGSPFEMMKKYDIKFSAAGENIAGNQTIEKAIKAWSKESGNNLFNKKFTLTGIGIVESPMYGKIFVQMFIKK